MNRIKYWRQMRGLSQMDLADQLATSQATVSRLEKGELDLSSEWADRICQILDLQHPLVLWPWSFIGRIQDDVELADEDSTNGLRKYRVLTDVLSGSDAESIPAGSELLTSFDPLGNISIGSVRLGDRVIAQASTRSDTGNGLILREVDNGGLLRTSGPGVRISIGFDDPDIRLAIVAVVLRVLSRPKAQTTSSAVA